MIGRILSLTFFLLACLVGYSQNISASIDFARFKANDSTSLVEIYISIDANSIQFNKNENNKYNGVVYASIKLSNDGKNGYFEKFYINSPEINSEKQNNFFFNFSKRIITDNENFKCEVEIKDKLKGDTTFKVNFDVDNRFNSDRLLFSDIQLLDSYEKSSESNDYIKNGIKMNPSTTNFYPTSVDRLKYYVEIYNTEKEIEEETPFVLFTTFRNEKGQLLRDLGKFSKHVSSKRIAILNEISMKKLPSGNYFLILEARNKDNKLIGYAKKYIQRANTAYDREEELLSSLENINNFTNNIPIKKLGYYMECLRPIATELEYHSIKALRTENDSTKMRNYFFDFWKSRYSRNAQKEWLKYEKRIKYTDRHYSCFSNPGYYTEMGRIYLKYGAPNQIEDQLTAHDANGGDNPNEYQIWQYFTTATGQSNKIVVFNKTHGGRCDYDLIHSTINGEYQNQDWLNNNNWRQRLQKNTGPLLRTGTLGEESY